MRLGHHLRQNAVAYLALVVALSTGSAYAAAQIANGSVTTKKLANNAVTSNKLKNNSVKSIDIKTGTVNADDIGTNAVGSQEIGDNSVTTVDIQDGTVQSADIKDDTIVRQDINDGVVPQDADILATNLGATNPPAAASLPPGSSGLYPFAFTLDRNAKLVIQYFAGAEGVTCSPSGQGKAGIYIDGTPQAGTLVDVPSTPGAVRIVTNQFLNAGSHTLSIGETCDTGTAAFPTQARGVSWTVELLAR